MKIIPTALLVMACSSGEDVPNSPPVLASGRISVHNETISPIRLLDFTQKRGEREEHAVLDIRVYSQQTRSLINLIDGGDTDIFPGGDRIQITFVSEAPDPNDPNNPLFENTASLTVNGSNIISVKSGGEYGIGPG